VDSEGKLIGINTMINSTTGEYSGVGFAIPSTYAYNIAQQIMDGKGTSSNPVEHAFLGVSVATIDPSNAARYGVTVKSGAYVADVTTGAPAAEAGILKGDVIVSIGGTAINNSTEVVLDVRGHLVGDTVEIVINRAGQEMTMQVTLGSDATTS
jgi:putative serine protease PepD